MGRMPHLWGQDSHHFKPSRHIDPTTGSFIKHSPYLFTAFNAGPRLCLGQRLAHVEAKCLLAKLITKYRWRLAPQEGGGGGGGGGGGEGEPMVMEPNERSLILSMKHRQLRLVFEERGETDVV